MGASSDSDDDLEATDEEIADDKRNSRGCGRIFMVISALVSIATVFGAVIVYFRQTSCLGFDECPSYPLPFPSGEIPKTYEYAGSFPDDFVWGLGTASYQIEGAYNEGGRGASIWDTFTGANTLGMPGANCSYCCKEAPCPINKAQADKGATGNVACDHYHTYEADIAFMKSMNLKHYRFSIAWPRIFPTGFSKDGINMEGIRFYDRLIDKLVDAGITPYVTLYHWDLPQGLLNPPLIDGWYSRDADGRPNGQIQDEFLAFCNASFFFFGDRVKFWATFNEAWTFTFLASGYGKAPSISEFSDQRVDPFIAGHNVLNAHAAAVDLYRRKYQSSQGGKIGMINNCDWREPKTANVVDVAAAERALQFQLGWFADPIYFGDYPAAMRRLYGSRLPEFTPEQTQLLNGSADFFGFNHYGTKWASFSGEPGDDTAYAQLSPADGSASGSEGLTRAESLWLWGAGWGVRKILNWIHNRYHPRGGIYVTEGGWSLAANSSAEAVADRERITYYANYTWGIHRAITEDNVDVRGFFGWSLMDNFEWERGYTERFGTSYSEYDFGLDPNSPWPENASGPTAGRQWRQCKESACWLEAVRAKNALVDPSSSETFCQKSEALAGSYSDAEAPNCHREIIVEDDGTAIIKGTTQIGRPCDGWSDIHWDSSANVTGGTIITARKPNGAWGLMGINKKKLGFFVGYLRSDGRIIWGDGTEWIKRGHSIHS